MRVGTKYTKVYEFQARFFFYFISNFYFQKSKFNL
jgi:hypothetical protein